MLACSAFPCMCCEVGTHGTNPHKCRSALLADMHASVGARTGAPGETAAWLCLHACHMAVIPSIARLSFDKAAMSSKVTCILLNIVHGAGRPEADARGGWLRSRCPAFASKFEVMRRYCLSSMTTAWQAMERFSPRLSTFSCVLALMFTTLRTQWARVGWRTGGVGHVGEARRDGHAPGPTPPRPSVCPPLPRT